jgi:hypothetical protein
MWKETGDIDIVREGKKDARRDIQDWEVEMEAVDSVMPQMQQQRLSKGLFQARIGSEVVRGGELEGRQTFASLSVARWAYMCW